MDSEYEYLVEQYKYVEQPIQELRDLIQEMLVMLPSLNERTERGMIEYIPGFRRHRNDEFVFPPLGDGRMVVKSSSKFEIDHDRKEIGIVYDYHDSSDMSTHECVLAFTIDADSEIKGIAYTFRSREESYDLRYKEVAEGDEMVTINNTERENESEKSYNITLKAADLPSNTLIDLIDWETFRILQFLIVRMNDYLVALNGSIFEDS